VKVIKSMQKYIYNMKIQYIHLLYKKYKVLIRLFLRIKWKSLKEKRILT